MVLACRPRGALGPLDSPSVTRSANQLLLGPHHAFRVGLLAIAIAAVFANTLRNEFHLDDFYRIRDNPEIRRVMPIGRHFVDPSTISGSQGISESRLHRIAQYRPLLPLTLSLNYAAGGYRVEGYHVVNIAIHLLAAVLVYFLMFELLGRAPGIGDTARRLAALGAALAFGIHPVAGNPVNYILARDLLLMQAFLAGSLLVYVVMRRRGGTAWGWVAALVLFELALLSKATAAVAPALVLAFEWTAGGERVFSPRAWARAGAFGAVLAAHLAYAALGLEYTSFARVAAGGGYAWSYPMTQAAVHVFHYLPNFFWPFPVRMAPFVKPAESLSDPRVLIGLAVIVGSVAWAWFARRRFPVIAFAILAYWILMIPESSFVPQSHLAVDYRAYASSPFLFLALAIVIVRLARSGRLPATAAAAIGAAAIVWFAAISFVLNRTYRTEETMWAHTIRYGGEALAHMNYAMSLPDRRDPRVRYHLEEALRRNANYVLARINLGLLLMDLGEVEEGLGWVEGAAQFAPSWPQTHYWLSVAYDRVHRTEEAAAASERAAELDPRNLQYVYKAAVDASRVGNHLRSLEYARQVRAIDPDYEESGFVEGFALQMSGRSGEAITTYREFLARHPGHATARFNLAYAFMTTGRCDAAIVEFRRVLEIDPEYEEARTHLAACESGAVPADGGGELGRQYEAAFAAYRAGDYATSLEGVRRVLAIDPEYGEARFLEGFDLQMLGRLEEALVSYRVFLEGHPDHAQVHFNSGHALQQLGRCREAVSHFQRAAALQPSYEEARQRLAECQSTLREGAARSPR